jgi:hypothetical protein
MTGFVVIAQEYEGSHGGIAIGPFANEASANAWATRAPAHRRALVKPLLPVGPTHEWRLVALTPRAGDPGYDVYGPFANETHMGAWLAQREDSRGIEHQLRSPNDDARFQRETAEHDPDADTVGRFS